MKILRRREFIQTSALAAGALAFPSIFRATLFGQNAPGNRLNVALIGCGNQGVNSNLRQLLALGQNVVAVCDVDLSKAQKGQKALKVGGNSMADAPRMPPVSFTRNVGRVISNKTSPRPSTTTT